MRLKLLFVLLILSFTLPVNAKIKENEPSSNIGVFGGFLAPIGHKDINLEPSYNIGLSFSVPQKFGFSLGAFISYNHIDSSANSNGDVYCFSSFLKYSFGRNRMFSLQLGFGWYRSEWGNDLTFVTVEPQNIVRSPSINTGINIGGGIILWDFKNSHLEISTIFNLVDELTYYEIFLTLNAGFYFDL
ncbi:MAG: hypothetical protein WCT77_07910 [Bacteroidota bacterium]|jgi:hypothetical protein